MVLVGHRRLRYLAVIRHIAPATGKHHAEVTVGLRGLRRRETRQEGVRGWSGNVSTIPTTLTLESSRTALPPALVEGSGRAP